MKECNILSKIREELKGNDNKISKEFVEGIINQYGRIVYQKIGNNTRVCVITLCSGHSLVGYARVIDPSNDVEKIGNKIAREKAEAKVWELIGMLAIAIKNES